MKHSNALVLTLSGCMAGSLLLAGQAMANELENPGAETGDLTGWVADDAVSASLGTDVFVPHSGDWLFLMGEVTEVGEVSVSMQQSVDLAECSNEHIRGRFTASGQVATDGDHWGSFTLDFGEGPIVMLEALQSEVSGEWIEFGPISGPVPDAATAEFTVWAFKEDLDEIESSLQVAYDDLVLTLDCVEGFAKVGGRIGQFGNGNAPELAFSGAVGTLTDGSMADSSISINYRPLGSSCDFSIGESMVFTSDDSATIDAEYACSGGEKDGQTGIAVIDVTAKDASGCVAHANRDRGSIALTADDADLDVIGGDAGHTGTETCLEKGNVEVQSAENGDNGEEPLD